MKQHALQTNFTAGELSPVTRGRVDLQRYANGAASLENFVPMPVGGLTRRPGSVYWKTSSAASNRRLKKFQFSVDQTYVLEFHNEKLTIHTGDETSVELLTPYREEDLHGLVFAQSADVVYIAHQKYAVRTLSRFSVTDWRLELYATEDGPYSERTRATQGIALTITDRNDTAVVSATQAIFQGSDVGKFVDFLEENQWRLGKVIEVLSASRARVEYLTNTMEDVEFETYLQANGPVSSSVGRITPLAVLKLTGSTVDSSVSDVFSRYDVGKYVKVGTGWHLIQGVQTSAKVDVAAAVTKVAYTFPDVRVSLESRSNLGRLQASSELFKPTDVGRHVRLDFSAAQTWGVITEFETPLQVKVEMRRSVPLDPNDPKKAPNGGQSMDWRLGAFSETTGHPRCVALHSARLWFGGTPHQPQTLWGSEVDDYVSFAPTEPNSEVLDTSAMTLTLGGTESYEILWLSPGPVLLIGTSSSEWVLRPGNAVNEALTPSNYSLTSQTDIGSKPGVEPVRIRSSTLAVQSSGRRLWSFTYDFSIDAYKAEDLTLLSDHILGTGVVQTAHQKEPFSIVWLLLQDGTLVSLTYEKDQEVVAWARHVIAQGFVESIVALPSNGTGSDTLYLAVRRVTSSGTVRTLETLRFGGSVYLDGSFVRSSQEEFSQVSGLNWLDGVNVQVVSGYMVQPVLVVNGDAVFSIPQTIVQVGVPCFAKMETLPPEFLAQGTSSVGMKRLTYRVSVRVQGSVGVSLFKDAERVVLLDTLSPYSGVLDTPNLPEKAGTEGSVTIGQHHPFSCNILSVVQRTQYDHI